MNRKIPNHRRKETGWWKTLMYLTLIAGCVVLGLIAAWAVSGCARAAPKIVQGQESRAEMNALKAEVSVKDNEINALKASIGTLNTRVAALQNEAGGDINSTLALIVSIVATPTCFVVYMASNRLKTMRAVKGLIKGNCS